MNRTGRSTVGRAGFLLEVIEKSAGRQHVCAALNANEGGWPRALLAPAAQRFHEALDRLLVDAKYAGAIRADVRTDDLIALMSGGAALCSAHRDRARGSQLVRLLLSGLRTRVVTKDVIFRDDASLQRHETKRHCVECGVQLRVQPTGRPARYCGPTCRQRARRRRIAS
jgi:hypothetical protein